MKLSNYIPTVTEIKSELQSRKQVKDWCNDPIIHRPIAELDKSKLTQK